jgi:hypothetical protein
VSGFHKYPPFKTIGTCGIRPGGLPRWLKLLTKLAAITTRFGSVIANASTWPGQTSFSVAKTANLPKIHPGRRTDSICQVDIDIGGPFVTRWTQVDPGGFFRAPTPGGVHPAKKSYRTYPKVEPPLDLSKLVIRDTQGLSQTILHGSTEYKLIYLIRYTTNPNPL